VKPILYGFGLATYGLKDQGLGFGLESSTYIFWKDDQISNNLYVITNK